MRIAVISDIHGNMPALEATLKDIHTRRVDKIVCLGDLIGKGPSSKETIDLCRSECDLIVRGNWDYYLFKTYTALNQGKSNEVNERTLWCIQSAGAARLEYLGTLPHSTELLISGKLVRLFHAHPLDFSRYFADSPLEKRLELFDSYNADINKRADVAVYADIHSTYLQMLQGGCLINVGSVGNPLDITQASYAILEGGEKDDASFNVQFVRVQYDIEKAVSMAVEANVPDLDGYISELRTAVYFSRG